MLALSIATHHCSR